MGIRVVQRATAPPSPIMYNPTPPTPAAATGKKQPRHHHRISTLFGRNSEDTRRTKNTRTTAAEVESSAAKFKQEPEFKQSPAKVIELLVILILCVKGCTIINSNSDFVCENIKCNVDISVYRSLANAPQRVTRPKSPSRSTWRTVSRAASQGTRPGGTQMGRAIQIVLTVHPLARVQQHTLSKSVAIMRY